MNLAEHCRVKTNIRAVCHSLDAAVCAGGVLLMAASTSAQNLFVGSCDGGYITGITPGGVKSTFASGLGGPEGLAFDSAGDLFEADYSSGNIYEFTPGGVRSTFASGLGNDVWDLAFQGETLPVPEPSALGLLAVGAAALLVRRRRNVAA